MADTKTFLHKLNKNLNILQEREAKYNGEAPPALLNQIDDHKQAMTLTQQYLDGTLTDAAWQEALRPLLISVNPQQAAQNIVVILNQVIAGESAALPPLLREVGGELQAATLGHLRQDPKIEIIVDEYEQDPVATELLLAKKLAVALEQNMDFADQLRSLLWPTQTSATYQSEISGKGATAQGTNAGAAYAEGEGVAVGKVGGDFNYHRHEAPPDPAATQLDKLQQRYLEQFAHTCNVLHLGALGSDPDSEADIHLDDVYIELDTTSVPAEDTEKGRAPGQNEKPLSAMQAAAEISKLVLVGKPGSGKSTFVRQLAGRLALAHLGRRELPLGWPQPLWPILTSLRELHPRLAQLSLDDLPLKEQNRQLVAAVCGQWQDDLSDLHLSDLAGCLDEVLAGQKLLLIFDGLDEVPEAARPWIRQAVRAVQQAYANIERVIVTCRTRSYTGPAVLPGFTRHELAPFDDDKIKHFVHNWYHAQADRLKNDEMAQKTRNLQQAVLDAKLRSLAENPMLLTTMAIIHQKEVGLPSERVVLYDLAVQVLLNKWQKAKGLAVSDTLQRMLNDTVKLREILQHLAYELHQRQAAGDKKAVLSRSKIIEILEEPKYLGDLGLVGEWLQYVDQRAGILVGHGGGEGQKPQTYDFPHRTFQEYLAGCQMVTGRLATVNREYKRRVAEGDTWALAGQLGAEELFFNRSSPETLLDLAYSLCPESLPVEEADRRAVLWSGQMAVVLGKQKIIDDDENNGPQYWRRLIPRLVQLLEDNLLTPLERAETGRVLADLGDPRPGVLSVDGAASGDSVPSDDGVPLGNGVPDIDWCEIPAGKFIMGSDKEKDDRTFGEEMPQHALDLPVFRISRYPITNGQYQVFVADQGYREEKYWPEAVGAGYWQAGKVRRATSWAFEDNKLKATDFEWGDSPAQFGGSFELPNHPVVGVTWYETVAYTRWLTEILRQSGAIAANEVITLPSEAQWEKAARGTDGRIYPWGNEADPNKANYEETGIGTTSAVGCFLQGESPYGCLDMSGNVWEWTRSLWGTDWSGEPDFKYPYIVTDGRENFKADSEVARVLRGGAFNDSNQNVRCAVRSWVYPNVRNFHLGFRVACHVTV